MNAQITEISNGFLVTVVTSAQMSQSDVLHNVKFINELHELKGAITEITENLERSARKAQEERMAGMLAQNLSAAKQAVSEGPRN